MCKCESFKAKNVNCANDTSDRDKKVSEIVVYVCSSQVKPTLLRDNSIVTIDERVFDKSDFRSPFRPTRTRRSANRFNISKNETYGDSIATTTSLFTTRRISRDLKGSPIKLWRLSISSRSRVSISQPSANESEIRERPLAYRVARV